MLSSRDGQLEASRRGQTANLDTAEAREAGVVQHDQRKQQPSGGRRRRVVECRLGIGEGALGNNQA